MSLQNICEVQWKDSLCNSSGFYIHDTLEIAQEGKNLFKKGTMILIMEYPIYFRYLLFYENLETSTKDICTQLKDFSMN